MRIKIVYKVCRLKTNGPAMTAPSFCCYNSSTMKLGRNMRFVYVALAAVALIFLLRLTPSRLITLVGDAPIVAVPVSSDPNADIEPQKPLAEPPRPIKALYMTNWSASSKAKTEYIFNLLETTELNAVVLDIKDYTGVVGYEPDVAAVREYGAYEKRIPKINALIKRFHDAGVFVIGRIAVFQDMALVKARPELAVQSASSGRAWSDRKGVHWLDTAATPVWDYNLDIARDALARGFDEINFDYIRFPTDGDLEDIRYPYYKPELATKRQVVRQFFDHLRNQLPTAKISADIFGEAVVNTNPTTIGQYLEDTFEAFDVVAPMIYPSHYHKNFIGLINSAAEPYPVIRYSMDRAFERFAAHRDQLLREQAGSETPLLPALSEFRPWIQDFNYGATYTPAMVRAQIDAVDDAARAAAGCVGVGRTTKQQQIVREPQAPRPPCEYQEIGWLLWNASNVYSRAALLPQ